MAIAFVIVVLVIGSLLLHYYSVWWFTPLASNWASIDFTVDITVWITGVVFVIVNLFLAYVVFRFRSQPGHKAHYEPENKKLEGWLVALTSIGIAAMLAPGLYVWAQFVQPPVNAKEVEAFGQQWHWRFRLPGADGQLGKVDTSLISEQNPLGIVPSDPAAADDILILSNELVLELDQPVKMLLRSADVLHNFTVPQFRVKMDLVPGSVSSLWFIPTQAGEFDVLCEELCGTGHFAMRGRVSVRSTDEYQHWLAQQQTFAQSQVVSEADIALGQAHYQLCAACHGAEGEGNKQLNAPALAGQSGWYLRRQLQHYQQGIRGRAEGDLYGAQMAAMANTLADTATMDHLLAFINSLPPVVAVHTDGDVKRGQHLYRNCASCHGNAAEGNYAMNAPRLAGIDSWYLARQLSYFKQRVRGNHPDDFYGAQMSLIAQSLQSEQDITDVVAYINSLQP
ncbi:c-type cytochrome [Rheinheimera oceanensis]|uniref:c-type cytochrome n=1 Tax=Rheinheimera oceanensis TaxID=2817449 RepID=UPI001BFE1B70|nr:c-type cytochrome [Rheinheimera oceanensis]